MAPLKIGTLRPKGYPVTMTACEDRTLAELKIDGSEALVCGELQAEGSKKRLQGIVWILGQTYDSLKDSLR